jgi:hypothetical protein
MEQYEQIAAVLALTMGAAWASGINLYAAMAVLGFSGASGSIDLPPDLLVLQNPLVIAVACIMYVAEFVADKMPGVDTAWDSVHTFIRIPAGALMAAAAVGDPGPAMELSAYILGGGLAAASHATKAGSRVIINASPEPFTNWAASITEDVAVIGGLWAAMHYPWLFLAMMIFFILFMIWILPKIWRGIKKVFQRIGRLFGAAPPVEASMATAAAAEASPPSPENRMERYDELERLKQLLDSGALTEEEFTEQKQALLKTEP